MDQRKNRDTIESEKRVTNEMYPDKAMHIIGCLIQICCLHLGHQYLISTHIVMSQLNVTIISRVNNSGEESV